MEVEEIRIKAEYNTEVITTQNNTNKIAPPETLKRMRKRYDQINRKPPPFEQSKCDPSNTDVLHVEIEEIRIKAEHDTKESPHKITQMK